MQEELQRLDAGGVFEKVGRGGSGRGDHQVIVDLRNVIFLTLRRWFETSS